MSVTVVRALLGDDLGFEYILRNCVHHDDFDKILKDFTNMCCPKKYPKLVTFVNDIETIREIMKNCRECGIDNDLKNNLIETSLESVLKIIGRLEPNYIGDESNSVSVIEFLNELRTLYDNDLLMIICESIQNSHSTKITRNRISNRILKPSNKSMKISTGFFIKCFEEKLKDSA